MFPKVVQLQAYNALQDIFTSNGINSSLSVNFLDSKCVYGHRLEVRTNLCSNRRIFHYDSKKLTKNNKGQSAIPRKSINRECKEELAVNTEPLRQITRRMGYIPERSKTTPFRPSVATSGNYTSSKD